MDVLNETESAITARVSGDSVYLTRQELKTYHKKIHEELSYASALWWLMDLQEFEASRDSYEIMYRKVFEMDVRIKNLNLKIGA